MGLPIVSPNYASCAHHHLTLLQHSSKPTGDLFPGQNPPRKVDEELEHFVVKACEVTGNHPDDLFCLKVGPIDSLVSSRRTSFATLRPRQKPPVGTP